MAIGLVTALVTVATLLAVVATLVPLPASPTTPLTAARSPVVPGAAAPVVAAEASATPGLPTRVTTTPRPAGSPAAASAAPLTTPGTPIEARVREVAPLTAAGRRVGQVSVQGVREAPSASVPVGEGERLMVATVSLDASASNVAYDERDWRLEDEDGRRYDPVADGAGKPLGSGTLAASDRRTGEVAFVLPTEVRVRAVVLTDGSGADLVVFSRPSVTS